MRATALPLVALLAAVLGVEPALADVTVRVERGSDHAERIRVRMLGGYRSSIVLQDAYAIDLAGTVFEKRFYLDHRLRVGPELDIHGRVFVGVELDLLTGLLGGHLPDTETAWDERLRWDASGLRHAEFRQAYLRVHGERAVLEAGLLTDHWGLGAVVNDGGPDGDGFGDDPFGTDAFGDRVLRVGVNVTPALPGGTFGYVQVQLMLDLVALDERTHLIDGGELALGPGLRVLYDTPLARAGGWLAWRTLRTRDGATAELLTADLFVDRWLPLGRRDARFHIAAELAGEVGRTSLEAGWPVEPDRTALRGAAVLDGGIEVAGAPLLFGLRAGLVSGDPDPTDGTDTGFSLDRDFNVGLILFDEVLAGVGARAAVQVEELTGRDASALAREGGIGGGLFALPYLSYRPHPYVDLRLGGLLAAAPTGIGAVQPVVGGLEGLFTAAGSPLLGGELDVAVTLEVPVVPAAQQRTRFGIRLEYGHLFPGPALTEGWSEAVGGVDLFATRMGLTF